MEEFIESVKNPKIDFWGCAKGEGLVWGRSPPFETVQNWDIDMSGQQILIQFT